MRNSARKVGLQFLIPTELGTDGEGGVSHGLKSCLKLQRLSVLKETPVLRDPRAIAVKRSAIGRVERF